MELTDILLHFFESTENVVTAPISNGHINHTYLVTDGGAKYILQKINTNVFPDPDSIAFNHLCVNGILSNSEYSGRITEPFFTLKKNYFDEAENCWRMTHFIEGSETFLRVPNPVAARKASEALSEFYYLLNSCEHREIKNPLPGFIDFDKRMRDFEFALQNSELHFQQNAKDEIEFIIQHNDLPDKWLRAESDGLLPQRIIHADPKISNLLFDNTGNVVAVIDLDTVMRGPLLYDFGDMVRSYTNLADEDDAEMIQNFNAEIFEQVKSGFLSRLQNFLTKEEIEMLDYSGQVVIYIQAVRFLADYLNGSVYYATNYPEHNLDRAKNQINLLKGLMRYQSVNS